MTTNAALSADWMGCAMPLLLLLLPVRLLEDSDDSARPERAW